LTAQVLSAECLTVHELYTRRWHRLYHFKTL